MAEDSDRRRRIQKAADACAAAYGFEGDERDRVSEELQRAFAENKPFDWDALKKRAGRALFEAALREQGLSDEEIVVLRRHFRAEILS